MTTADSTTPGSGGKRALLARLLTERAQSPRSYPVSFGQQRLWFLDRFSGGIPVYNIPVAFRVHGPLDVAALRTALTTLVNRHPALRTTFSESGGEPVQVVRPTGEVDLTETDLTGLPAERREAEATTLVRAHSGQPFDLAGGPLLRVTVIRTDTDRYHVAFCVHHIVSDAWSIGVLFKELATAYPAALAGAPAHLPDLPTQYADFSIWQRDRLAGDALRRQLDHWVCGGHRPCSAFPPIGPARPTARIGAPATTSPSRRRPFDVSRSSTRTPGSPCS